jgi:fengycin family lipopeptide synthetase D
VVQSTGDLQSRIDRWLKLEPLRAAGAGKTKTTAHVRTVVPERPLLANPYVPPRNSLEQCIAEIWQELLGFKQVGGQDNFLELGGDSVKAITVLSRIHQKLHVKIQLQDFFHHPTVQGLAELTRHIDKNTLDPITPVEQKTYYALSSAQKRLYFLQQLEPQSTNYNVPMAALLEGPLNRERFNSALVALVERHESFRTSFRLIDSEPVQHIHNRIHFQPDYLEATEIGARHTADTFIKPFELDNAPLLRVCLVKITQQQDKHLLVADMHHIITDWVSMEIFSREFTALYRGDRLPAMTIQYKDFSQWQNSRKLTLEKQEQYWLNRLKGDLPVLDLPSDFPRPDVYQFKGNTISSQLDSTLTGAIKQLVKETGATLFVVLLAAFDILLFKYTAQEDILLGTVITGRSHPDLRNIIGMFVNMLVLRSFPKNNKTFGEFLKEIREDAFNAFDNQDYQFEDLVKALKSGRESGRHPLVDVVIALEDAKGREAEINDLKLTPYDFKFDITRSDLALHLFDTPDGLDIHLEYAGALFRESTVQTMLTHYIQILEQITADSDVCLKDIAIEIHDKQRASVPQILDGLDYGF